MTRGFARVSVAVPEVRVTDFEHNVAHTLGLFERAHAQGDALVVFPEMGICGYTVRDLVFDGHLLDACLRALGRLVRKSTALGPLLVVGMPVRVGAGLYNCAVAVHRGRVLGVVPKSYLPTHREFEEARFFRPGREVPPGAQAELSGATVPFGTDLLFVHPDQPDLCVGIEICEDLFVQAPPHARLTSAGATIVANLSASNFTVGKAELRRLLVRSASERGQCAYLYVAAGPGESSTDLAFDADAFICEAGQLLGESTRFARGDQLVTRDVDLERLVHERAVVTTFGDCAASVNAMASANAIASVNAMAHVNERAHALGPPAAPLRRIPFRPDPAVGPLRREVSPHPFLPADPHTRDTRCWEVFEIQSNALSTRVRAIGEPKLILGVSGGLDSTMAALVCAAALDLLGRPRSDLRCVTMPGLGTSQGTRENAERLAKSLGATFEAIPMSTVSHLILRDLGHPATEGTESVADLMAKLRADPRLGDITVENVQARLRTLMLMSLANLHQGLVVGTGDLSEKALGWSTYAGDHIAMYDVNAGVPKTLIQFVIRWVADQHARAFRARGDTQPGEALREALYAILDTPISPELLPLPDSGEIAQRTEETIGPYELHDFFLYHVVRHGARPGRVLDLAQLAFAQTYPLPVLKRWLSVFYRRFFRHQFKRSCTADAPKVGLVALSPRSDWRMPSDAQVGSWLAAVEAYPSE